MTSAIFVDGNASTTLITLSAILFVRPLNSASFMAQPKSKSTNPNPKSKIQNLKSKMVEGLGLADVGDAGLVGDVEELREEVLLRLALDAAGGQLDVPHRQ